MSGRLVALGDIHAHHTELMTLYQQLLDDGFNPEVDTLIGLGDALDGGPDAKKVIDQLLAWQQVYPHWVFLRGNHEQMMLDALDAGSNNPGVWDHWWSQGGRRTAYSYLPENATDYERAIMQREEYIDPAHIEWIRSLPLRHETNRFHFVHAGFRPGVPIEEQSEEDMLWIRESFFRGIGDFGKPVIFGHTPVPEPMVVRYQAVGDENRLMAIGIDTMVGDFGKLTAVELTGATPRFFFQPAEKGPFEDFDGFR